jgi:hypothetical protein
MMKREELSGKLFDDKGQPLCFCTTRKNGRQYRYYVSRALNEENQTRMGRAGALPRMRLSERLR